MSQPKRAPKYRPVLTVAQMEHIVRLAKTEVPLSFASIQLIATLDPYLYKIQSQAIAPSSVPSNRLKVNSLEALGGIIELPPGELTKEDRWLLSYTKYSVDPTLCTLSEIQEAQEHRYLNGLMSTEEIAAFEEDMTEHALKTRR